MKLPRALEKLRKCKSDGSRAISGLMESGETIGVAIVSGSMTFLCRFVGKRSSEPLSNSLKSSMKTRDLMRSLKEG
jgi:hypothetical protein